MLFLEPWYSCGDNTFELRGNNVDLQPIAPLGTGHIVDFEKMLGPMRIRAWGLVANCAANVVVLYGLALLIGNRPGWVWLLFPGAVVTIACLAILAIPAADPVNSPTE